VIGALVAGLLGAPAATGIALNRVGGNEVIFPKPDEIDVMGVSSRRNPAHVDLGGVFAQTAAGPGAAPVILRA
jgi:hypothetical protein